MVKREYAEAVLKAGNFDGQVVEVVKDNIGTLTGIAIKTIKGSDKNGDAGVTFYIDWDYKKETPIDKCVDKIKKILEEQASSGYNDEMHKSARKVLNFDEIKDKLLIKILNKKLNENNSGQVSRVCSIADGLIEVLYIDINDDYSARVSEELLKVWKKTKDEVFDIALKNLKKQEYVFETLEEHLERLSGRKMQGESPLYIITNKDNKRGANMILVAIDDIKAMFPEGFYLIPNTIHEFMVCSKNAMPKELLQAMLNAVNSDLPQSEFLSDTVYEF